MHTMLVVAEVIGGILGYMAVGITTAAVVEAKVDQGSEIGPAAGAFWPIVPVIAALYAIVVTIGRPVEKIHRKLVVFIQRERPAKLPKARKIERLQTGD